MSENISSIKDDLFNKLNPSAFTFNSVIGIIIIVLIVTVVYNIYRHSVKAVSWCLGAILMFQILYGLSLTGFNNIIPFGKIFKYDIFTAIAQCFVGTPICDFLLYLDSIIIAIMNKLWDLCNGFLQSFGWLIKAAIDLFIQAIKTFFS